MNQALLSSMVGLHTVRARLAGERCQTLTEYGLLAALVAVAVLVAALIAFRGGIMAAFDEATQCLL